VAESIIDLTRTLAIVMVAAYGVFHTGISSAIFEGKSSFKYRVIYIMIFGLFSIYGTIGGVKIGEAYSNVRDLGPLIAGLLAGPAVGLGAGLIGGIHRLSLGGFTALPCGVSTVIAGLLGGMVYLTMKKRFLPVFWAMLLATGMEFIHMGITLLLAKPFDKALEIVSIVIVPMVLTNALGIGVFGFIFFNLKKERDNLANRERLEGELEIARHIQMSMIPETLPTRPGSHDCNIDAFALIQPALEVGGDVYDWLYLDEDRFAFIIGDAAGKGIPASLFMAVARTLIRGHYKIGKTTGEILSGVNEELCRDNEMAMFITLFMGILHIPTGEVTYTNAGHPSPYVIQSTGTIRPLPTAKSPALGVIENVAYESASLRLEPGDILFAYTDGVTEATDSREDFYKPIRLESALRAMPNAPRLAARTVCDHVLKDLRSFVGKASQADDITMIAVAAPGVVEAESERIA